MTHRSCDGCKKSDNHGRIDGGMIRVIFRDPYGHTKTENAEAVQNYPKGGFCLFFGDGAECVYGSDYDLLHIEFIEEDG